MLITYKSAAFLSALLKGYNIACHDRDHIKIILVLQNCTDSLRVLPSSSRETFSRPSAGTHDVGNITLEEEIDVIEETLIAIHKEEDIGIKQEEIPEAITFPDIKSEPDEVRCVYTRMSVIRHNSSVSRNVFFLCPYIWRIERASHL
jgi:hypothetical protein